MICTRPSGKFLFCFICALFLILGRAPGLRAQMMPGDFDMDQVERYLPPIIQDVTFKPQAPAPGDEITFYVKVRSRFSDDMSSVEIGVSTDSGATWQTTDMDEDSDAPLKFQARVGPFPQASRVLYRITAADPNGNRALWLGPLDAGTQADKRFDNLPPLIIDSDDSTVFYPGLDIKTVRFGYDDKKLLFRIEYGGPVDGGTLTPLDANAYALVMLNMRLEKNAKNMVREENLKNGLIWAWAPAAAAFSYPASALIYAKTSREPGFFEDGFEYKINSNIIELSVDRDKFINENTSGEMSFILGTGKVTSITPFKGGFIDYSMSATVYFQNASIALGSTAAAAENPAPQTEKPPVDDKKLQALVDRTTTNPSDPIAFFNLAEYYDETGKPDLAIGAYQKVIEINDDPDAHFNLGVILFDRGRNAEAEKHFKRYLESDSDSDWAQKARDYLERIKSGQGQ